MYSSPIALQMRKLKLRDIANHSGKKNLQQQGEHCKGIPGEGEAREESTAQRSNQA